MKIDRPRQAPVMQWGVLGAGGIARQFADAQARGGSQHVRAIGSRSLDKAQAFAAELGLESAYGSYEELVADPAVEAVYIATPHSRHRDDALLAISAGKHVLVEKAFARNQAEAQQIVDAARAAGVFCMEAMWTRFLPHMIELRSVIAEGLLGDVVAVSADHGQYFAYQRDHRLFAPELAGGALLDLGIYPVSFAVDVLGLPTTVTASGTLTQDGVDAQEAIGFTYHNGAIASLYTTLLAKSPTVATVVGTQARLEVAGAFYAPTSFTLITRDGQRTDFPYREVVRGYEYEAAEVARRVAAGEKESPLMPLDQTVAIMGVLDDIRRQLGVSYPGEQGQE